MNGRKDIAENVMVIQKQRVIKDYSVGIYTCASTSHKVQSESLEAQAPELMRLDEAHRTPVVVDIFINVFSAKTGTTRSEFTFKKQFEKI